MKVKLLLIAASLVPLLQGCDYEKNTSGTVGNNFAEIHVLNSPDCLWKYTVNGERAEMKIAPPEFEVEGKNIVCTLTGISKPNAPLELKNKVTEYVFSGHVREDTLLELKIIFRVAPCNPVIRFKYILESRKSHRLTKTTGTDELQYIRTSLKDFTGIKDVQFSNFDEKIHSYVLAEQPIESYHFDDGFSFTGPMLVAEKGDCSFLLSYEHGSQYDNPFLQFKLRKDRTVALSAVKGNYLDHQLISPNSSYETIWFEISGIKGSENELATQYRSFILNYISDNSSSRKPYIYYNTWGRQERVKWNGGSYLQSMNSKQTLAEIDKAHELGVDVFVIDAGWFRKTGDWDVNTSVGFFPDSLTEVTARLRKYNMKLGLWFNPGLAAVHSKILMKNYECRAQKDGKFPPPFPVWETENSIRMCLVSDFWKAFSDELIRLSKELNVTYFKWDAVEQGDCDSPGHFHGTDENTMQERRENDAFLQPVYMAKIIERVCEVCPEAIFDFDITEKGRCTGIGFLASGRFHAMNNGPYYHNLDLAPEWKSPLPNGNVNIFVYPGPARTWFTRSILTYDKWIPSILFLTHYQADGSKNSQIINIASLILGQNGIWGEILKIPDDATKMIGEIITRYKQVSNDITLAAPYSVGKPGEIVEIHEKINSENGKGTVVIFNNGDSPVRYVTSKRTDKKYWSNEYEKISFDDNGRAVIEAVYHEPGAKIIFFGVEN